MFSVATPPGLPPIFWVCFGYSATDDKLYIDYYALFGHYAYYMLDFHYKMWCYNIMQLNKPHLCERGMCPDWN